MKIEADQPIATQPVIEPRARFSYCVECGSWGEHRFECSCCGFNFRADAVASNVARRDLDHPA